jgi:redox-sensitive bicupin YhaK (pirin superfamily)
VFAGCSPREKVTVQTAPPEAEIQAVILEIVALPAGTTPWPTRDPFLFCVHHFDAYPKGNSELGPAQSLAGRNIGQDFAGIDGWRMYHGDTVPGFPSHPHRGFETVTVVRQGLLDHSDSMGASARYGDGDVQWLTAGAGIQHAEMFPLLHQDRENPAELFQIWLNLPAAKKFVDPHFTMLWHEQIPDVVLVDGEQRETRLAVVAGTLEAKTPPSPPPGSWASDPISDVSIWTLQMEAHAEVTLPPAAAGTNRSLYFYEGADLMVGDRSVPVGHRLDVTPDRPFTFQNGAKAAEALLLQGRPIGEPVVSHGPFVMNTRAEIAQAIRDYQSTGFGGWPWPRKDPVHGAAPRRFARHADGQLEEPS